MEEKEVVRIRSKFLPRLHTGVNAGNTQRRKSWQSYVLTCQLSRGVERTVRHDQKETGDQVLHPRTIYSATSV